MNQVSIIIPVHNTPEEYLRECLHSVLRQDYTNWEAILIDDGSTSGAERICDEYAAKDARFCVIHQRQSGVSAARNAGMAAANGDWLIFLDSDDWWEENLLSSAMKKLAEEPADLLVFGFKSDINGKETIPFSFAPAHVNRQRAAAVGALAEVYYKEGKIQTAEEHEPEYLRKSQAERERAERESVKHADVVKKQENGEKSE